MKIVHLLFDDYPYVIDWGYQENKFVKYQLEKHDVTIITGRYIPDVLNGFLKCDDLKKFEELEENGRLLEVYRLDSLFANTFIGKKIRYYKNLNKVLNNVKPDVIFIHDLHSISLITVNKYIIKNNILCNADVHVNYVNSCRNKLSFLLHRFFYRYIIQNNVSGINKIYYLNKNSKKFIEDLYGLEVKKNNLQLLTLGGEMTNINEKVTKQNKFKKDNDIPKEAIIFIHSGKMNKLKKTLEVIDSFSKINDANFILLLMGIPAEEIKEEFYSKIKKDTRIHYLGWKTNDQLMNYLMIGDVYLQPGSPSVTAHEALCKGCATVLSSEGDFYLQFIDTECAIYLTADNTIEDVFKKIEETPIIIEQYKKKGYDLAGKIFDYRVQSELILKW